LKNKPTLEKTETKLLNITLPEELMERVKNLCAARDITIQDFVTDAIIEKLELANKERRKKSRL
jgi:predicted DNA binding CopG/RHH family protein